MSTRSIDRTPDPAVEAARPFIVERLAAVERERRLRVVFACESGSRAWGFASGDSDFDVRFIYVRPAGEYLRLRSEPDAFDIPVEQTEVGELDLAGWDLRKAAGLMMGGNATLQEWLDSPIIYTQEPPIADELASLRETYFDPKKAMYHYTSLASGIWKKYLDGRERPVWKRYLYSLRPLACVRWIEMTRTPPPMVFERVLDGIDWKGDLVEATLALVERKRASEESSQGEADGVLHEAIPRLLSAAEAAAEAMEAGRASEVGAEPLDALIRRAVLG